MDILLIGVNHCTAPVELRERLAFSGEQACRAAAELRARGGFAEAVVLSTCNRSEFYGVAGPSLCNASEVLASYFTCFHEVTPAEADSVSYRRRDTGAVRHLFRVAAGLDSMLLGEAEILGQVRQAYKRAFENGTTGPCLNRLFQGALEVGKRVRAETELGTRPMSVAFAAVKLAEQIFGRLSGHTALVLGAGAVSEQLVDRLRDRGIARLLISNRSKEHAEVLARGVKGEVIAWDSVPQALARPDIVVSSVGSAETVLNRETLERAMRARGNRSLFVIDLGMPRNVDASASDLYNLYLYNIDDLSGIVEQNRRARESEIPKAESIIAEHVAKFESWQAGVQLTALIEELREKLRTEREEFLQERRAEIEKLSAEDRHRFGMLAEHLLDQLVREPAGRVKAHGTYRASRQEVEAVRRLLGLAREEL